MFTRTVSNILSVAILAVIASAAGLIHIDRRVWAAVFSLCVVAASLVVGNSALQAHSGDKPLTGGRLLSIVLLGVAGTLFLGLLGFALVAGRWTW